MSSRIGQVLHLLPSGTKVVVTPLLVIVRYLLKSSLPTKSILVRSQEPVPPVPGGALARLRGPFPAEPEDCAGQLWPLTLGNGMLASIPSEPIA